MPGPSLTHERRLLRSGAASVVGIDEVGRGSLAGPVTVGAVLVLPQTPTAPAGLRDSKALTPQQRNALRPKLQRWAPAFGVGHAQPDEIDLLGLTAALRLAAVRALRAMRAPVAAILLDGCHDWLASTAEGLPEFPGSHRVTTRIKADRDCSAVAAASVLAKVARDALMVDMAASGDPYGWRSNKGYAAPEHLSGLRRYGPCRQHRLSWQLPGVGPDSLDLLDPDRRRTWRRFAGGEQLILLEPDQHHAPAAPIGADPRNPEPGPGQA